MRCRSAVAGWIAAVSQQLHVQKRLPACTALVVSSSACGPRAGAAGTGTGPAGNGRWHGRTPGMRFVPQMGVTSAAGPRTLSGDGRVRPSSSAATLRLSSAPSLECAADAVDHCRRMSLAADDICSSSPRIPAGRGPFINSANSQTRYR
jgi:hypothetical protein